MKIIIRWSSLLSLLILGFDPLLAQISGDTNSSNTPNFSVSGTTVTGSGTTVTNGQDYFWGKANTSYTITTQPGSNLFYSFLNAGSPSLSDLTSNKTPNGEVIAIDSGIITNHGILTTSPNPFGNTTNSYHQTTNTIFISESATIYNYGTIGDMLLAGTTYGNLNNTAIVPGGYLQEDEAGIKIDGIKDTTGTGLNTSLIENYGTISGNNAFFSGGGSGIFINHPYAVVLAGNDGLLTGYDTYNYPNGALQTIYSFSYACTHAYGLVQNYGYMLGQDYGILQSGNGSVINDYGGPAAVDSHGKPILNYNGAPVYNGEISTLYRNDPVTRVPETENTALTGPNSLGVNSINMTCNNGTVNLISQTTSDGKLWLPEMVSPMVGGFLGDGYGAKNVDRNTLNFDFNGLDMVTIGSLVKAVYSRHTNANGGYYSGSWRWVNPDGIPYTYYFSGWSSLNFIGIPNDPKNPGIIVYRGGVATYYQGTTTEISATVNTNINDPVDGNPLESNIIPTPVTMGTQVVTGNQPSPSGTFICNGWKLVLGNGTTDGIIAQNVGNAIFNQGTIEEDNVKPESLINLFGTGSVIVNGKAPLYLTAGNPCSGPVTITNQGTAVVWAPRALGTGSVTNNGHIRFGGLPSVYIGGTYTQGSTGTTDFHISSATLYNHLFVNGNSNVSNILQGTINIYLFNGYNPPIGTKFTLMTVQNGGITLNLTSSTPGYKLSVSGSNLIATVTSKTH